jgi:hypothetical protein
MVELSSWTSNYHRLRPTYYCALNGRTLIVDLQLPYTTLNFFEVTWTLRFANLRPTTLTLTKSHRSWSFTMEYLIEPSSECIISRNSISQHLSTYSGKIYEDAPENKTNTHDQRTWQQTCPACKQDWPMWLTLYSDTCLFRLSPENHCAGSILQVNEGWRYHDWRGT